MNTSITWVLQGIVTLFLLNGNIQAQTDLYPAFNKSLESVGAVFSNHPGYHVVPPVDQHDIAYQYAFRKDGYDAEIRIFLHPVDATFANELENKKFFLLSAQAAMMNISQPADGNLKGSFQIFPTVGVTNEFHAAFGMTGLIPIHDGSQFGKGYKFANVISVWKPKVGFIYTIFLFNDLKKVAPFPTELFYCTIFKDPLPAAPE